MKKPSKFELHKLCYKLYKIGVSEKEWAKSILLFGFDNVKSVADHYESFDQKITDCHFYNILKQPKVKDVFHLFNHSYIESRGGLSHDNSSTTN